jgi:hypothetical protein
VYGAGPQKSQRAPLPAPEVMDLELRKVGVTLRLLQISALGIDERFGLLVEAEHLYRDNLRLIRLLREAKLKLSQACVEDIDYAARRELDRAVVRQLATCRWVPGCLRPTDA